MNHLVVSLSIILVVNIISGCAGTGAMMGELTVESRMSNTIFLDPVKEQSRTVFLQVRNTSGKSGFIINDKIRSLITKKGYKITEDPEKATYWLQANVIFIASDKKGAERVLAKGFSDTAKEAASTQNMDLMVDSIVRAGTEMVANKVLNEVYYAVVTDLQLSERLKNGEKVTVRSGYSRAEGNSGYSSAQVDEQSDMKRYQTRILSAASQTNLSWDKASNALSENLANVIAGLL